MNRKPVIAVVALALLLIVLWLAGRTHGPQPEAPDRPPGLERGRADDR